MRAVGLLSFVLSLVLTVACAASGQPPAAPTSQAVGYLEGSATIGPLSPVERVGVPTSTPAPEVCTSRGLAIYQADGKTEVTSFSLRPDCTYREALRPGAYVVGLKQGQGIGGSKDLPRTVTIREGETLRLNISIDTGIR